MVISEYTEVTLPRNPENAEKFTPRYASLVFFNSFRHSQGLVNVQKDIFSYLHIVRPEWQITSEDKPKILEISQNMIFAFLFGDQHGRKESVTLHDNTKLPKDMVKAIVDELDEMEKEFNDKEKNDPEKKIELIQKISDSIIDRDWEFLQRERKKSPNSKKPLMDPWLSHIVHFGLNGNSTGVSELDEMYRDIRALITRPGAKKSKNLAETLNIYRRKHPGVKINLKP